MFKRAGCFSYRRVQIFQLHKSVNPLDFFFRLTVFYSSLTIRCLKTSSSTSQAAFLSTQC